MQEKPNDKWLTETETDDAEDDDDQDGGCNWTDQMWSAGPLSFDNKA